MFGSTCTTLNIGRFFFLSLGLGFIDVLKVEKLQAASHEKHTRKLDGRPMVYMLDLERLAHGITILNNRQSFLL